MLPRAGWLAWAAASPLPLAAYQTNPAHIELICVEEAAAVEKADDKPRRHLNRKQVAIRRLRVGGGVTKAQ